ncbi:MAG: response regulator [bacterium]|nr:response regulator [bacterium]
MAGERILVVDNDESVVESLSEVLKNEAFVVYTAEDGHKALEIARKEVPDLILLDIIMPDMDGFEVCQRLKDNFFTAHIPIIMLTVRDHINDKVKGLDLGADDYINKPYDYQELIARIGAILRRTHLDRDSNPLTGLPGNITIERKIKERISSGELFAVLYADLDDFKPYNDYYGYSRGDEVIRTLCKIILSTMEQCGSFSSDFVGHIGGDDFIIVTTPDKVKSICENIINKLEQESPGLFREEDRKKGYIEIQDRQGNMRRFPTSFTITISVATNQQTKLTTHLQISDIVAELKRYGKRHEGSIYVIDRRTYKEEHH